MEKIDIFDEQLKKNNFQTSNLALGGFHKCRYPPTMDGFYFMEDTTLVSMND